MIPFLEAAANVRPTQRQLAWFEMGAYAFIHFGMNTFTDREWGTGDEPESLFNPQKLDCDQWVEAVKAAGLRGLILTAKHHDGFCLWPSAYTRHCVKNAPCKRDIVREAAEACRRGGIRFGFYLSPWDRNSPLYGTPAYNDYFCDQLTELLTRYGEIFCVWFDGACGEGPNGKRQVYDFPRYVELIRKYQPGAVIFNDGGPDVRWCGNEAGRPRHAEWAVVPIELADHAEAQTGAGPLASEGDLSYLYNCEDAIGTMPNILYSKGLAFVPSEYDMSIRKGWFWHPQEDPKSLEHLFQVYLTSAGANACLNLNIPPDKNGLIDERDVRRLRELGDKIRNDFGAPLPATIEIIPGCPPTQPRYRIVLDHPRTDIRYVVLSEDITCGQRVESFRITQNGSDLVACYQGTCIGHRRICALRDPFEDQNPLTATTGTEISSLTIHIAAARDEVLLKDILVY